MSSRTRPSRILAILVAAAAVLGLASLAAPARADATDLRERVHARVGAIMQDAVDGGIYTSGQMDYVDGAILPAYIDPLDLPNRVEAMTVRQFWEVVSDATGLSTQQVKSALRNGATLNRLAGSDVDALRTDLYRWLARPVVQAQFDDRITYAESVDLRDDIQRAVYRAMAQPGGGRDVVLDPRLN